MGETNSKIYEIAKKILSFFLDIAKFLLFIIPHTIKRFTVGLLFTTQPNHLFNDNLKNFNNPLLYKNMTSLEEDFYKHFVGKGEANNTGGCIYQEAEKKNSDDTNSSVNTVQRLKYKYSQFIIDDGDFYAKGAKIFIHRFYPDPLKLDEKGIKGVILFRHGFGASVMGSIAPIIEPLVNMGYEVFAWDNLGVAHNTGSTKDFATILNVGKKVSKHIIDEILLKGTQDCNIILMGNSLGGYEMAHIAKYLEEESKYTGLKFVDYNSFSSVKDIFQKHTLLSPIMRLLNFVFLGCYADAKEIIKKLKMPVFVMNREEDGVLKDGKLAKSGCFIEKDNVDSTIFKASTNNREDNHCDYDISENRGLFSEQGHIATELIKSNQAGEIKIVNLIEKWDKLTSMKSSS